MFQRVNNYVRNHRGGLVQLGIGVAELGLGYLLTPNEKASLGQVLQDAVAAVSLTYGLLDTSFGIARSSPYVSRWEGRRFRTLLSETPTAVKCFYRAMRYNHA